MLVGLVRQILLLHRNEHWARTVRRMEIGERLRPVEERRAQPRDVEPRRDEVALDVIAFRLADRRVELDEQVALFDALPVAHVDRAHHAGLERLNDLAAPAGNDLALRGGDDVDLPERAPPHPHAETTN